MYTNYKKYVTAACFILFALTAFVNETAARVFPLEMTTTLFNVPPVKDNTKVCIQPLSKYKKMEHPTIGTLKNTPPFFKQAKALPFPVDYTLNFSKPVSTPNINGGNLAKGLIGFEENKGQVCDNFGAVQEQVKFRFQPNRSTSIFLTTNGLVYQFNRAHKLAHTETYRMDMLLAGASPSATITTEGESEAFTQYFKEAAIRTRHYQRVTYHQVYPGIDWVIYINTNGGIKYDFVVQPGANPKQIKLRYTNAEGINIGKNGALTIANRLGKIVENAPVSFQDGKSVATSFVQKGNDVVFNLTAYDASKPLTIDPALNWATYYGDTRDDAVYATEVDSNGNVYICGTTNSNNMASGGYDNSLDGNLDAFLAKFNASGVLQWATYYGGGGDNDTGYDCAVDEVDNVILCGTTNSNVSIASSGAHQTARGGKLDAFIVKFDSGGFRTWATYYGGAEDEQGISCITDANRAVYLCGGTKTQESVGGDSNIGTSGAHQTVLRNELGVDAVAGFLVKFNSAGVRQWGTYLGGETKSFADIDNDATAIACCATDANNNVFVSGSTGSNDLGFSGHKGTITGSEDYFLAKFNSSGVLQWGTYYYDVEGSNFPVTILNDGLSNISAEIASCDVDADNHVIFCGRTNASSGVATSGAYKTSYSGISDAYILKFSSTGSRLWATYTGGNKEEFPRGVCVDGNGNIYIAGFTDSNSGLAIGGNLTTYQSYTTGAVAFLQKFDTDGNYDWGTYHGGTTLTKDYGYACAVNNTTNQVYLAGVANSATGIADGGHQNTKSGFTDGFLVQFKRATFLPVQLGAFNALCQNGQIQISWTTLTEIQNKHFIVERSTDQQSWKAIADIAGAGNTTQPRQYSFKDADANASTNYYRLRQIDFDGKEAYSPIVSVQCGSGAKPRLVVYPNPAVQFLNIQGLSAAANYRIVNTMGQAVKTGQVSPSNASINVAALQPGMYFLSIENKLEHFTQKVEIK